MSRSAASRLGARTTAEPTDGFCASSGIGATEATIGGMRLRQLGSAGPAVFPLALGCMGMSGMSGQPGLEKAAASLSPLIGISRTLGAVAAHAKKLKVRDVVRASANERHDVIDLVFR